MEMHFNGGGSENNVMPFRIPRIASSRGRREILMTGHPSILGAHVYLRGWLRKENLNSMECMARNRLSSCERTACEEKEAENVFDIPMRPFSAWIRENLDMRFCHCVHGIAMESIRTIVIVDLLY